MDQSQGKITISATVNVPLQKAWDYYTQPEHIVKWNAADKTWHTVRATNDVRTGGKFLSRMEPKDDPAGGFDFEGTYDEVVDQKSMKYTMSDKREVELLFSGDENSTEITINFDPENENAREYQAEGWQSILNNFKSYAESLD